MGLGLRDEFRGMRCDQDVRACVLQYVEKATLEIWMEVYVRFIDHQQRRIPASDDVGQHLTPHLEAETRPVQLPRDPILQAEHVEARLIRSRVDLRQFDVHAWPRCLQQLTELRKPLREMVPDVAEVP